MIEFDRGPSKALAQHLANAPGYPAAQRKLFWYDWGPAFYRGRVSGSARLLVQQDGFVVAARVLDLERLDPVRRAPEANRLPSLVAEGDDRLELRPGDRVVEPVAPIAVRTLWRAAVSPGSPCRGARAKGCALTSTHARVNPSFDRKPWTRCPASPTSVRQATRSVGPGSEAIRVARRHRRPRGNRHAGQRRYASVPSYGSSFEESDTHPSRPATCPSGWRRGSETTPGVARARSATRTASRGEQRS
jgi:hypothetical protein